MKLPIVISVVCAAASKLDPRHASAHEPIGAYIRSLVGQDSTLVFATAADSLYSRYALAYASSMGRLRIANFLVLCMDSGVLSKLQAKGIPAYYDPLVVGAAGIDERAPAGKAFTAGWLSRTRCKVLYTQGVVASGCDILLLTQTRP